MPVLRDAYLRTPLVTRAAAAIDRIEDWAWTAVPNETACREIASCGQGTYGDIPFEDDTEFVDPSYSGDDSDGSVDRPWRTVQPGVDAAAPGAI